MDCLSLLLVIATTVFIAGVNAAPRPIEEALPPGANQQKTEIVCEDQKAYIKCENIFDVIEISRTMFGRRDKTTCLSQVVSSSSVCEEQAITVNHQIKDLCNGVPKCEVSASSNVLAKAGTIICPQVYKYLEIKYRCLPIKKVSHDSSETDSSKSSEVAIVANDDNYHSENTASEHSELVQTKATQTSSDIITEVNQDDRDSTEESPGVQDFVNETFKKSQTHPRNSNREESDDEENDEEDEADEEESSDDFQGHDVDDDEAY